MIPVQTTILPPFVSMMSSTVLQTALTTTLETLTLVEIGDLLVDFSQAYLENVNKICSIFTCFKDMLGGIIL